MKVLIACEYSGIVREAFKAKGHDAWSCDLLDTEILGNHIKGDVMNIINNGWDLMIAHPPCTYFANAGLHYLKTRPERTEQLKKAFVFWMNLWDSRIKKIAMENPVGWLNTHWRKPKQIIQPYYFGDYERKTTCLWLKGLSRLNGNSEIAGRIPKPNGFIMRKTGNNKGKKYNYYWRQGKSAKDRSKTFPGIAKAMAEQWG